MNKITVPEHAGKMLGVDGRFFNVIADDATGVLANQTFKATRYYKEGKDNFDFTVKVRFDDDCKNGHPSFAITGDIRMNSREWMGGCVHDEIAKHFPELAPLIKWHLTSTDGPMHYAENTLYWLGYSGWCDGKVGSPPNLVYARSSAVWPDMPESLLCDPDVRVLKVTRDEAKAKVKIILLSRLGDLQRDFVACMKSIGFVVPS